MILLRKGILELVLDFSVNEEVFEIEFAEYCRRCNIKPNTSEEVREFYRAAKNIENQFEKL